MRIKQFIVAFALTLFAGNAIAQQPLNVCCHPDDIKSWTPGSNPDDAYNVAKVPLQKRFKEPTLMKANAQQFYEGEICNSTILYPTCSLCPSQGEVNNFLGYQPTYWQYMDKLVYWAGAASEGIINIPPAASTDAAHAQGVKSLGNIFFPPAAFGGNQAWVRQMLTVENGKYIYAVKLYEMAKFYGFDGWFINEESGGGSTSEWEGFIKEFYKAAMADDPNTQMEIQWYNASRSPNTTLLKTHVNTSQFLEYGAVGDYRGQASALGCTTEQTFKKIYAGVELAKAGHVGWQSSLNTAMPTSGHVGSLDLFCPETKIWEDPAKSAFKSVTRNHGTQAYPIGKTVFENDEDMWVNYNSDPSNVSTSGWTGISSRVLERSAITAMPFLSDMGVGNGKHRFVEGQKAGTRDWYHSGMQSILPTWRWWIENKGNVTVAIDWDNAYNVGSSFKFSGKLTAGDHLVRLYKTQIPVTAGGVYRIVYKTTSAVSVEAKLSTESSTTPDVTLAATTTEVNGWTVADFDLSSLNGKTVYMLAFNLKADAEVANLAFNLGQVAVLPVGYAPAVTEVKNLVSEKQLEELKNDLRIHWNYDWTAEFDHFNVYVVTATQRELVGMTRDEGFYVPTFDRNGNDHTLQVEVVPVMKNGKEGQAQSLTLNYPAPQPPVVTVKPSISYLTIGQTAKLTMKGTGHPTAYEWALPAGLELSAGSLTSQEITVKATSAGKKVVTAKATNDIGTTSTDIEVLEVLEAGEENSIVNVALNKTVVGYSGSTNSTEVPARIIDGVQNPTQTNQKWCNVSSDNWVTFDLEGAYRIYGFKIFDGNSGPESGVDQIDSYKIMLSQDGTNWVTVVDEEDRETESIKTDYICPFKARYVKLVPHVNGTLRIWEFEVYGKEDNNMTLTVDPAELKIMAGETKNITVSYNLNGDKRENVFTCTAKSGGNVTVGKVTENQAASTFTIPVTGNNIIGSDVVTITLNNGGAYKERSVNATIDSNTQPNVLAGRSAKLRHYNADYSYEATYDEYTVNTLTDGDKTSEGCLDIEDPSTHKRDVWAIFEAPTEAGWNLAKVKVYIPANNFGKNDNDKDGIVNKQIEICVGNDLTSMTTIKTFSDLGEISELEYILPEYKNTKYLAIVSTLNAYFYASLAEVEAFEQYESAIPVNGPVSISNWPDDVIAEGTPVTTYTTSVLDNQGWCLFTPDVREKGALPIVNGLLTTKNGTEYAIDATKNNSLVLKSANAPKTATFANPAFCEELYFIVISAEGSSSLKAEVVYEDGTTEAAKSFTVGDWWNGSSNQGEAIYGLDRIKRGAGAGYQADQFDGRTQFRIFEYTLTADKSKRAAGIKFTSTASGKIPTILGVAKKGYNLESAGIFNIFDNGVREIEGIYTIGGVKVNNLQKGINIIRYTNGTSKKVMVK